MEPSLPAKSDLPREDGPPRKAHIGRLPSFSRARMVPAHSPAEMVRLSANENPLGPSPRAVKAMAEALESLHRYPDAASRSLREALAARLGLTPEMVLCGNGADELLLLTCLAFLRHGDEAVMSEGTFVSYGMRVGEMGARARRVPLRHYTHDLEAMARAVTGRTRLLFVCNPNNPTGTCVGAADVARLLDRVPPRVLVILDEAYGEYVERTDYPDAIAELKAGRRNLLVLRSFSKIHGLAGLRLGYALGEAGLVDYLDRTRPPFNVNALAQVAGLAALSDELHLRRSRAHASAWRRRFTSELRSLGVEPIPGHANFLAVHVGDDRAVAARFADRGFAITALSDWGVPGCVRIAFGTDAENWQFLAAARHVFAGSPTAPRRRRAPAERPAPHAV